MIRLAYEILFNVNIYSRCWTLSYLDVSFLDYEMSKLLTVSFTSINGNIENCKDYLN